MPSSSFSPDPSTGIFSTPASPLSPNQAVISRGSRCRPWQMTSLSPLIPSTHNNQAVIKPIRCVWAAAASVRLRKSECPLCGLLNWKLWLAANGLAFNRQKALFVFIISFKAFPGNVCRLVQLFKIQFYLQNVSIK